MKKKLHIALIIVVCLVGAIVGIIFLTIQNKPLSVEELLNLGEKYLLEMDYEQALVCFEKAIEVDPMNPQGYIGEAEVYIGLGEIEEAILILETGYGITRADSIEEMLLKLEVDVREFDTCNLQQKDKSNTELEKIEADASDAKMLEGKENSSIANIISKMFATTPEYSCALVSPEIKKNVGNYVFSSAVKGEYVYYSILDNRNTGLYSMPISGELSEVKKLSTDGSYNISATEDYLFYTLRVNEFWPLGYMSLKSGARCHTEFQNGFYGLGVIGEECFCVRRTNKYGEKSPYGNIYTLYKVSSRFDFYEPFGIDSDFEKLVETEDMEMEIVGCYDNGTILVKIDDGTDEGSYTLYDTNGNKVREVPAYQAKAVTFGRNYEIALTKYNDVNGIERSGFVLEDGTFYEDDFVAMLYNECRGFYIDVNFSDGDIFYLTKQGEVRRHSLITGEDTFIISGVSASGIMFVTDEYIYLLTNHNAGLTSIRCKLDGSFSEETSVKMFLID